MDIRKLQQAINDMIRPLSQKILMSVSRAIIQASMDSKGIQLVKVELLQGEVREDIERFQNFGFSSRPPDGSEAIALAVGGNREHMVIIACDKREVRFKNLANGESAIYTDDGTYIHLKKNGAVEVKAATSLTIDVPNATFKGNLKVEGDIDTDGNVNADGNVNGDNLAANGAVTASTVTASGSVTGATVIAGGVSVGPELAAIKSGYNGHTHSETGITTSGPSPTIP